MDLGPPQEGEPLDETLAELERLTQAISQSTADGNTVETATLHFRAAQICLASSSPRDLPRRAEALTHLWACWQLRPEDIDVRAVLAHQLAREEKLEEEANLLRSTAEHTKDAEERSTLLLRAAKLLSRAGDLPEALAALRRLQHAEQTELQREQLQALRAFAQSLDGRTQCNERIEVLQLLLALQQGEDCCDTLTELAGLYERAGRADEALAAYRQAFTLRPGDPATLEPLEQRLEQREAFEELAAALEAAAQAAVSPRRQAALLRRLAQLAEVRQHDTTRAVRLWWKAWQLDASGTESESLRRIFADLQDWHQYARVLEREAFSTLDEATKVRTYRELARLQRDVLEDDLSAAQTYGFLLQLLPDDEIALAARVEIFAKHKLHQELALALQRFAAQTRDVQRRDKLLRQLARLDALRPSSHLVHILRRLQPSEQENRQLVRELRAQIDSALRPAPYLELGLLLLDMERQAHEPQANWIALAEQLAVECLAVGAVGHATDCYRRMLELEPTHAGARAKLEELTRSTGCAEPSAAELMQRANALAGEPPEQMVRTLLQTAMIAFHQHAERDQVTALLRRAAGLCPPAAHAELALVEEALRWAEMPLELAALLEIRAREEQHPQRRKDILRALAQVHRHKLQQPEQAIAALSRALALDPSDREIAQEVRTLHAQLGHHEALVEVLENLLATATGRDRIPFLAELARLYAEQLGDRTAALDRYGELLAIVPDHCEALAFRRAHDEANGDYRSVAVLLCRAAEAARDPISRAEAHREVARLAEEKLADLEFAITHWRHVVELCPADAAPRAELKRLLGQSGRWPDLARELLSEVSRSLRSEEKVPLYIELAQISLQHAKDEQQASSYLRNALQLAPENREVLRQLAGVCERLGQWRELAATLRRHAEVEPDPAESVKLLYRAARVLFMSLNRDEEALSVCRRLRALHPGDQPTAALMAEIFAKRGEWREKVTLLQEQLANTSDARERGHLHLELGRVLLDQLNDSEGAAGHFEQALELADDVGEVLPRLRQLYQALGRWEPLVELIQRRAFAESLSNTERALALCEIGHIKEEQLQELAGAKEAYERALHLDPACRPALEALRALALRRQQWREVVALCRRELQQTTDRQERARLLVEIGELQARRLERASAAAEALEQALELDPNNLQAAEQLGALYFESADWERAGQLLARIISSGLELKDQHVLHYRLGFAAERSGRVDEAFSHYVRSFSREPLYLPTLSRLVELCYARRQWDNTLRIAEAIITTYGKQKTPQELAELYLRIGLCELLLAQRDVAVKQLQKLILDHGEMPSSPAEAWTDTAEPWAATPLEPHLLKQVSLDVLTRVVKAMERVLGLVPAHPGALQVLAALAITRRDWERSLRCLERASEAIVDNPRLQVGLLVCAGDIAHRQLLLTQRARGYYRRALEILPASELARDRLDMLEATPARGNVLPPPPSPTSARVGPPPPPLPPTGRRTASLPAYSGPPRPTPLPSGSVPPRPTPLPNGSVPPRPVPPPEGGAPPRPVPPPGGGVPPRPAPHSNGSAPPRPAPAPDENREKHGEIRTSTTLPMSSIPRVRPRRPGEK